MMNARNASETVRDLILLPRKYSEAGTVPVRSLLCQAGYFENHSQISEGSIREQLTQHPECVDEWARWSEDKRSSSGWYFEHNGRTGKYVVGYFADDAGRGRPLEFGDRTDACAAFIKREIEDIRCSS